MEYRNITKRFLLNHTHKYISLPKLKTMFTKLGLGVCPFGASVIIAIYNYYYSIVKTESFRHRFTEMAIINIGIAAISFLIGYALRVFTGIEL